MKIPAVTRVRVSTKERKGEGKGVSLSELGERTRERRGGRKSGREKERRKKENSPLKLPVRTVNPVHSILSKK